VSVSSWSLSSDTLDLISTEARKAKPGRALLALIGGLLFMLGWLLCKSWQWAFFAGAWAFTAVRVGWRQAQGKPLSQPSIEAVLAENQRLREQLRRVS
jgi:hypothetical protein